MSVFLILIKLLWCGFVRFGHLDAWVPKCGWVSGSFSRRPLDCPQQQEQARTTKQEHWQSAEGTEPHDAAVAQPEGIGSASEGTAEFKHVVSSVPPYVTLK